MAQHVDAGVGHGHAEVLVDDLRARDGGDVLEDALAAIAEAGALMATQLNVPRSLFSRMVASASPSTSSATMNSGRPDFMISSSRGTMSWMLVTFWSVRRM